MVTQPNSDVAVPATALRGLKAMAVYAITETRLLPAKTQRFIEFLRERLGR